MLIGIMGQMGSGKTLAMTILGQWLHQHLGVPLFSNYQLAGSQPVKNMADIWALENGVFCYDEIWVDLDSRAWKDNINMTRWVNQTRKKRLLVIYTTQHISQVELRIRNGTDILIYTERQGRDFWWNWMDYQYLKLGRRYLMSYPQARLFFPCYNTEELIYRITK